MKKGNNLTIEEFREYLRKSFEKDYIPNYLDPKHTQRLRDIYRKEHQ